MTKRKIILLSTIAILSIIYIVQITQSTQSSVESISFEGDVTGIRITQKDGSQAVFTKQVVPSTTEGVDNQERWILQNGQEVESFPLTRMAGDLQSIRVLGKVANASNAERYDLENGKALIVEALNGQEVLRTLTIGKASTTSSQTYAIIDNANDIVLVSGDLNAVFGKSIDELLLKEETEVN